MNKQETVVLMKSHHSHFLTANKVQKVLINRRFETELYMIDGPGIVTHGEHGTLRTESRRLVKYVQQELDPLSNSIINAFD